MDRVHKRRLVSARKIGTADAGGEDGVARKQRRDFLEVKRRSARRVPGGVD
ncbi:hypothetical protein SDC9_208556 [bioreactor metagenome]|uniref:Uncharacterized protein n=1 Tax=bioreactor metagenome TaxID=1076179 RepID=A0A645JKG7_9ZZZZ